MKPFVKGDWEGFFAFGLDALIAFILMNKLCLDFLGYSEELFYHRILPASIVGLVVGNLFYAYQALQLGKRENRTDVCAIPYGTSTLTIIIYVFLVMYPVQQKALGMGVSKEEADILSWHTGILACIVSGSIEFFGSFIVHYIRKITPRVVMLVAVAGTGIAFISMDYVFRTFAFPLIGFTSLALVLIFYFAGAKPKFGIPGGLIILMAGTLMAWGLYGLGLPSVVPTSEFTLDHVGLHLPKLELFKVFGSAELIVEFLPIVMPFGFIFLIGSLQNIESAAAAGDSYPARPLLVMNGVGSLSAAFFGSPFPTSIFLGHPGYKKIGARAGYSTINAIVWTVICLTGTLSLIAYLIPIEAIMPILIWIGVVVCAQNFQISEKRHMPAVLVGLTPAIAAYASLVVKHAMTVAGAETGSNFFNEAFIQSFATIRTFYADGMLALGQGFIFSSMILAGITYYVIDRKYNMAARWCLAGAVLSLIGFTHIYVFTSGDIIGALSLPMPTWSKWTTGYVAMALVFFATPFFTTKEVLQHDSG